MINKQRTLAAIAVITAALSLSACTGTTIHGQTGTAPATSRPAEPAPSTPPTSPAKSSQPAAAPSPDAQQTRTLIGALRAIEPALGDNERWAVTGAKAVCKDIRNGVSAAEVKTGAAGLFTGTMPGTIKSVSDDQARRIVDAVKASFCK
ncbi:hypothetical protein ACFU7T_19120 [Streptomyces sp. NPDC057555]|uniref:hypothetical protein n=1 Tax=Streptomyces sp. NPDC057555 TaxID=3346166 RepID=UPI003687FC54